MSSKQTDEIKKVSTSIEGLSLFLNQARSDERGIHCDITPVGADSHLLAEDIKRIQANITTRFGAPRGGHYHFRLQENFFTLSGTALWYFYDFNKNSTTYGKSYAVILGFETPALEMGIAAYTIDQGFAAQVAVAAGIYHIYWPLVGEQVVVVGTGSLQYDFEDCDRLDPAEVPGALDTFEKVSKLLKEHEASSESRSLRAESSAVEIPTKTFEKISKPMKAVLAFAPQVGGRTWGVERAVNLILATRPLAWYVFQQLNLAGFEAVGVICTVEEEENLKKIWSAENGSKMQLTFLRSREEKNEGAIRKTVQQFVGKEAFLFHQVCGLVDVDLGKAVNRFMNENLNALLIGENLQEQAAQENVNLEKQSFSGVGIFDEHVFAVPEDLFESMGAGGEKLGELKHHYAQEELKLEWENAREIWRDSGKPEDLVTANHLVMNAWVFAEGQNHLQGEVAENVRVEGRVKLGKGSRVTGDSVLQGPLVIGENCVVDNTHLGAYTSVGSGSELVGAKVANSLLMSRVKVKTSTLITNSVIGSDATLAEESDVASGKTLFLGKSSVIKW